MNGVVMEMEVKTNTDNTEVCLVTWRTSAVTEKYLLENAFMQMNSIDSFQQVQLSCYFSFIPFTK